MKAEAIAKGHRQKMAIELLMKYGCVTFREFCKSQSRYTSYVISWHSLFQRLKNAGYPVQYVPGKKGGTWTSKIILK